MRHVTRIGLVLVGLLLLAPAPRAQQAPPAGTALTMEAVADRITASESALVARLGAFHPIVEVYLQNLTPDEKVGAVPTHDEYFLGQFDWRDGPKLTPLSLNKGGFQQQSMLKKPFGVQYLPDGFAAMTVPDWRLVDRHRYDFTFVRREFLGEARCFVFDLKPKGDVADGFSGRIWVEDRDFNIVRFNGISRNVDHSLSSFFRKKLSFHVDSWRVNPLGGLWLPAYVYCEETDPARQLSPVASQRRWEQEAEDNVLEWLELLRRPAVPLASAREKVPLAVTLLMPYIRYAIVAPVRATSR